MDYVSLDTQLMTIFIAFCPRAGPGSSKPVRHETHYMHSPYYVCFLTVCFISSP